MSTYELNVLTLIWFNNNIAISDELIKLANEDYGRFVDKAEMARDKVLVGRSCFSAFVKRDVCTLDESFFHCVHDKDCTPDAYMTNYDKPIDDNMKKVAMKYALDKNILLITPLNTDSPSKHLNYFTYVRKYSAEVFS